MTQDIAILTTTDWKKSCMIYRMVPFSMTDNDR